jgi:hypothetical protein
MLFTWLFLVQSREWSQDDVEFYNELRKRDLHMGVADKPLHLHPHLLLHLLHPRCLTLGSFGKLLWLLYLGQLRELQLRVVLQPYFSDFILLSFMEMREL